MRVTFAAGTHEGWELRSNDRFVCRTSCTRWVNPSGYDQRRPERGPDLQTLDVRKLRDYVGANELEVRAHPRNSGAFVGAIVAAGVGGGLAFMRGMLALAGSVGDRSGLVV